ncbi:nuclear transport factor 2 family protein [Streptomyces sp. NPDC046977]|uniref:nuclear transport factor 2 family protein n=1 Tax=Streptomyces sp. NPDC046977 TaxID=3154703 RepID=UPI0033EB9B12
MNETSKNTAVKLIEAAVTGSEGAIRAAVSDTVIWHTPPSTLPAYQGPHHGPEAVIALIAAGGAPFVPGSRRVRVERCLAEGDHVAVDWRQTATLADGTAYDNLYSFRFRMDKGEIAEVWENFDTGYLYGRLGLDPSGWLATGTEIGVGQQAGT